MKKRSLLFVLLITVMISVSIMACTKALTPEGPETGVYYCDAGEKEALITLHKGNEFTFYINEITRSGAYKLDEESLSLTFKKIEKGKLIEAGKIENATYKDRVVTLTYESVNMRFIERKEFTVSFNTHGAGTIDPVKAVNGKSIQEPKRPVLTGFEFFGWYTEEALTKQFTFGAQAITDNITLHAKWVQTSGQKAFTVDFNLNYNTTDKAPAAMNTIGGKLYNVPKLANRTDAEFDGWWVSMTGRVDSVAGIELAYPWTGDMVFEESTTLHALWKSTVSTGSVLSAPIVKVSATTLSWEEVGNAVNGYEVIISGPDGRSPTVTGTQNSRTRTVDFASVPAGDYVVKVRALASSNGNNSAYTTRVYRNKALARVSLFDVVEPSALNFNQIKNATRYKITVKCGDSSHKHADIDIGNSTFYNFTTCQMPIDGIKFSVVAEASGFAASESKEFSYDRLLKAVDGFVMSDEDQTLSWNPVENATNYIIDVKYGTKHEVIDNGDRISYCLKEFPAADLIITVTPKTKGYNSPAPAVQYNYNKKTPATPKNLRLVEGKTITWDKVDETAKYTVKINGVETAANTNSYTPATMPDADLTISVMTSGTLDSMWSEPILITKELSGISYAQNHASWNYLRGVEKYEVKLNINTAYESASTFVDTNNTKITFTKPGMNTIYVRELGGRDWMTIDVYAYTLTLDTRNARFAGAQEADNYYAVGDIIQLPAEKENLFDKPGYELGGWYVFAGGAALNAEKYIGTVFSEARDMTLYAHWTGRKYNVTYNYGDVTSTDTGNVVYGDTYTLSVPGLAKRPAGIADGTLFVGWFTAAGGQGERLTYESGASLKEWSRTAGLTAYAYWGNVLKYTALNDGNGYVVSKGTDIDHVSSIVIPSTYKGQNDPSAKRITDLGSFDGCSGLISIEIPDTVANIDAGVFTGCTGLVKVIIPDSVELINFDTFSACVNLERIDVDPNNSVYNSIDGVIFMINEDSGENEMVFFPKGKTGEYMIPEGITSLADNVFSGSRVNRIRIPESMKTIPLLAFDNCLELTTITVSPANTDFRDIDGILCDKGNAATTLLYYPLGRPSTYTIPAGVANIGERAFYGSNIRYVTIPSGVINIGKEAFRGSNLITITFATTNSTLKTIGDYAFAGCVNMQAETLTIPAGVTRVGEYAFSGCAKVKNIDFLSGSSEALSIGDSAFNGCTALLTVTLPANLKSVIVSGKTTPGVSYNVFAGCSALTTISVDSANPEYSAANGLLCTSTEILFCPMAKDGAVTINDGIKTIGGSAFTSSKITSIELPASLKEIGANAFKSCSVITVTIRGESQLEIIGDSAFESSKLKTLIVSGSPTDVTTLPGTLTSIGNRAFYSCTSIVRINFLTGTAPLTFGSEAFRSCSGLTAINVPGRTTSMGSSVFRSTGTITELDLSATAITAIADDSFNSSKILSIILPANLTSIGSNAFNYCTGLKGEFVIPDSVRTIGNSAFVTCSGITTINLPADLQSLGTGVFTSCSALATIKIPAGLANFDIAVLSGLSALTNVKVHQDNPNYKDIDGVLYNKAGTELLCYPVQKSTSSFTLVLNSDVKTIAAGVFKGNTKLTQITISASVADVVNGTIVTPGIGANAFDGCTNLTRVEFTGSSTAALTIGNSAFNKCTNLSDIVLPARVVSIGSSAFTGCKFTTMAVPENTTSIGESAFSDCSSMTAITIPIGLKLLGGTTAAVPYNINVFNGCSKLETITVTSGNTVFKSDGNGVLFTTIGGEVTLVHYPKGKTTVSGQTDDGYRIPNDTTLIGASAFASASKLTKVIVPAGVKGMGESAFKGSTLTQITFEGGANSQLTTIGAGAFDSCKGLTAITLPAKISGLTYGGNANSGGIFAGCTNLATVDVDAASTAYSAQDGILFNKDKTELVWFPYGKGGTYTIPEGVKTIAANAFLYHTTITGITISAGVEVIGDYAFANCSGLANITFATDGELQVIGSFAFNGDKAITAVTIPASVKEIRNNAFYACSGITTLTFERGSMLESIGNQAFANCTGMKNIELPANLKTIGNQVFQSCNNVGFTQITLPASLTRLGSQAFQSCTNLATVEFEKGIQIETLGYNTFSGCTKITQIIIPASVKEIGEAAFTGCTGLTSIEFETAPNGKSNLKAIRTRAFNNCKPTTITLPAGIVTMEVDAFTGWTATQTIRVSGYTSLPDSWAIGWVPAVVTVVWLG